MNKNSKNKESGTERMVKATFCLSEKDVIALDKIRIKRIEAGAKRGEVDKSSLVRDAIKLLVKHEKL